MVGGVSANGGSGGLNGSNAVRRLVDLNGPDWQFGCVPQKSVGCENASDYNQVAEWLPATVPGNVRADLLALGRISDPFYGLNNEDSQWVDEWDWWYRKALSLQLDEGERAFLVFEGVDYISAVYLNGVELGRHEGMFSRQVYEITRHLSGQFAEFVVAVRIWGSAALPRPQLTAWQKAWNRISSTLLPKSEAFPDRIGTLKCQMGFGWDFAPRLRTMGIWDDVYLIVTHAVFIRDIFVQCEVQGIGDRGQKAESARVRLRLELDADREQTARAQVTVRGKNFAADELYFDFDLVLSQGPQVKEVELSVENPCLWQPWERGFPHLYEVKVDIYLLPSSVLSDSLTAPFGLRTIELGVHERITSAPAGLQIRRSDGWITNPAGANRSSAPSDAPPWTFVINGQTLFIRGANWVPVDALPGRARREDYAQLLGLAKEAGINMLRVWGGGLREKKAFYDLCDELGLLVWQEFPFACVFSGHFPRHESFLSLARRECTAIVRQLRNYPCLVLWCGGNEYSPRRNRKLIATLKAVVAANDGTRPFKDVSPDRGDSHNWRVWHGKANLRHYRRDEAQFASEFGLSSIPDLASLQKFIPTEHLWPSNNLAHLRSSRTVRLGSPEPCSAPPAKRETSFATPEENSYSTKFWQYHHAELGKLRRYARPWLKGESASLDQFIEATQKAQALGLQVAIEHFRRRKYRASGTLFWQFNEPWPAICWSVVDYYRRPKLAYHKLKQIYNPILISLNYPLIEYRPGTVLRAKVWAINDLLQSFEDCWLRILLDGKEIYSQTIDLPPDSCRLVGLLEHPLPSGCERLEARLSCQGQVISDNSYDLQYHDPTGAGLLDRLRSWAGEMVMR
jgi:beta-mannosidase